MGPITGPITTAMPKTEVTMPASRRGKLSSRTACDSGITGAPMPPCKMRQNTKDFERVGRAAGPGGDGEAEDRPGHDVAAAEAGHQPTGHRRHHRAVARMLNVIAQAISSAVAPIVPCICGNNVDAISNVVEYRVEPRITARHDHQAPRRRQGQSCFAVGHARVVTLEVVGGKKVCSVIVSVVYDRRDPNDQPR